MPLSTHVLDTSLGAPAGGLAVELAKLSGDVVQVLSSHVTNDSGRVSDLLGDQMLEVATYRLRFDVAAYAQRLGQACFFPHVDVTFRVERPSEHHHVPLLLSPYGYSTYRGS